MGCTPTHIYYSEHGECVGECPREREWGSGTDRERKWVRGEVPACERRRRHHRWTVPQIHNTPPLLSPFLIVAFAFGFFVVDFVFGMTGAQDNCLAGLFGGGNVVVLQLRFCVLSQSVLRLLCCRCVFVL